MRPGGQLTAISGGSHAHDHSDKVGSEVVNLPRLGYLWYGEQGRSSVHDREHDSASANGGAAYRLGQVLGHDFCVSTGGIGSVPGLLALGVLRLVRLDVLAKVGLLSLHRCSVFSVVVASAIGVRG